MAKGRRRDAGRVGIVDVDEIEVDPAQHLIERPADVERKRCRAGAGSARDREPGSERQHGRSAVTAGARAPPGAVEAPPSLDGGRDRPSRVAHLRARLGGGGEDHAVTA